MDSSAVPASFRSVPVKSADFRRPESSTWELLDPLARNIPTKLSHKDSDHLTQSSWNELQHMDIQLIEDLLEKLKQLYTNETGKTVIDFKLKEKEIEFCLKMIVCMKNYPFEMSTRIV